MTNPDASQASPSEALLLERLLSRTTKTESGCWLCESCRVGVGHARMWNGKTMELAHRLSYRLHVGPIPDGLFVCHSCDVPNCVNPAHLFLGTNRDNMLDARSKGRMYGQRLTHCKRGHLLAGDNVYATATGGRGCRTCKRMYGLISYSKNPEAKRARDRERWRERAALASHEGKQS